MLQLRSLERGINMCPIYNVVFKFFPRRGDRVAHNLACFGSNLYEDSYCLEEVLNRILYFTIALFYF